MSQLKNYTYEGVGEFLTNFLNYAQAVRVGDQLQLSGQGSSPRRSNYSSPKKN